MEDEMRLRALAKINLGLDITGKRLSLIHISVAPSMILKLRKIIREMK